MHYTIYFNQKPLLLTDHKTPQAETLAQRPGVLVFEQFDDADVSAMLDGMQAPNTSAGVFLHHSANALLRAFKQKMKVIEAGGGLVYNDGGALLLIFRNGKWDLPKGKVDEGEAMDAAALREVQEETGLSKLQLIEPLTITYHTYYQSGGLILKESHWFLMQSLKEQELVPQVEEGIEKCEWVKPDALGPYLENTHPSIVEVLQAGTLKLQAQKRL